MGLAEWFSTFCANIQVQDGGTISTRYKNITRRLNSDYWTTTSDTAHSLYVGSYGRNTAIQGISDLDMIFQLPYSVYEQYNNYSGNGQSALLNAVKTSIEKTYSTTSIRADGQVILVPFNDGLTFEVVPAFINKDDSFTYPDSNNGGRWRTTNPKPEIEAIRSRNAVCNGNLILLCRMMRSWKNKWNVPIGGLLIDTLAYQFIESYTYRDKSYLYYDYFCRDFLNGWQNKMKIKNIGKLLEAVNMFMVKAFSNIKQTVAITFHWKQSPTKQPLPNKSGQQNKNGEIFLGTRFQTNLNE